MKDGYTLYALMMVFGGLGAFLMVNFILTIIVMSLTKENTCKSFVRRYAQVMSLLEDTQRMLIGKHKHSYNPKDWALAALDIHMYIICIPILILVGASVTG